MPYSPGSTVCAVLYVMLHVTFHHQTHHHQQNHSDEATPLASGPTTSRFQAGPPGLQGAARSNCGTSCRRLPACLSRRSSPATIGRHRHVLRSNTQLGDRSFAAAGPQLWNSVPARIRQPDNDIGEFRRQLKSSY